MEIKTFFGEPPLRTAKEDIVCYMPIVKEGDEYYSSGKTESIILGKQYTTDPGTIVSQDWWKLFKLKRAYKVYGGFHSYKNIIDCIPVAWQQDEAIAVCIIPKGARYYKGNNQMVSDKIIYLYSKSHLLSFG